MRLFTTLALVLVSCPPIAASFRRAEEPTAKAAPVEEKKKPWTYPAFEPFKEARLSKLVLSGGLDKVDLTEQLKQLESMAEIEESSRKVAEKSVGKDTGEEIGALLQPRLENALRARYSLLPIAMMKLAPMWEAETWTKEQLAVADSVAAYVAAFPDGPKIQFVPDKWADDHARVEEIGRWFEKQVAKPELYASMIITMDDGPFVGLPSSVKELLPSKSSVTLDEKAKLELRLCKSDTEGWILQGVKDGKLLWSRVFSASPRGDIGEAEFIPEVRQWERYGFKAFMKINWTFGKERAYLYLDPKGELSFYFLTW